MDPPPPPLPPSLEGRRNRGIKSGTRLTHLSTMFLIEVESNIDKGSQEIGWSVKGNHEIRSSDKNKMFPKRVKMLCMIT